ncbi:Uncharacterised protein [uncultured archaeon]|nr:Uncharacterised protein [uncultured archaeon]
MILYPVKNTVIYLISLHSHPFHEVKVIINDNGGPLSFPAGSYLCITWEDFFMPEPEYRDSKANAFLGEIIFIDEEQEPFPDPARCILILLACISELQRYVSL